MPHCYLASAEIEVKLTNRRTIERQTDKTLLGAQTTTWYFAARALQ